MSSERSQAPSVHEAVKFVSAYISRVAGIQLGERQATMVESRLQKRASDLGMASLGEYLTYIRSNLDSESQPLISLLTTHHTFFFREFSHFEFLETEGLHQIIESLDKRPGVPLRVWSAACSRGQEVYSIAMMLDRYFASRGISRPYEVWGTDIDRDSVAICQNGVYAKQEIKEIPLPYLGNHWARGTGEIADFVKVKDSLRKNVKFSVANLVDSSTLPKGEKFDIIFCRNVFIYFTAPQIQQISKDLLNRLQPHGFLFVGVSESLTGLDLPVQSRGASIYSHRKLAPVAALSGQEKVATNSPTKTSAAKPSLVPTVESVSKPQSKAKVLIVDDSPQIALILKKVFSADSSFEVVGVATNGVEAHQLVMKLKPDLMTLDIHMPQMGGIEYLEKHFNRVSHPPVMMVSSVSREEASLAQRALTLGACDFVEKPALHDMESRGEEIRMKLKSALRLKSPSQTPVQVSEFDRSFAKDSQTPSAKNATLRDTWIYMSGVNGPAIQGLKSEWRGTSGRWLYIVKRGGIPWNPAGSLDLKDESMLIDWLAQKIPTDGVVAESVLRKMPASRLPVGERDFWLVDSLENETRDWLKSVRFTYTLMSDALDSKHRPWFLNDRVPVTSFAYMTKRARQ